MLEQEKTEGGDEGLLDVGALCRMLSYDAESGHFAWSVSVGPRKAGERAGTLGLLGYRRIGCLGQRFEEHRLAWLFTHGRWPSELIDHINGDPSDNRIANLREANRSENAANSKRRNGKSGLKGVSFHRASGSWQAQIMVGGRKKYLGLFDSPEKAHDAYVTAATAGYGEYARAA